MVVIKKEGVPAENSLDHKLTGDIYDMGEEDKVEVIKSYHDVAVQQTLNYAVLCEELEKYNVALSNTPDMAVLPEMNKTYAMAQAYLSRVTTIEMQAIHNYHAWTNLRRAVESYIEEKSSEYLVQEEIMDLPNVAIQQAAVRNKLKNSYSLLSKSKGKEAEAKAFLQVVESKKGDLNAVINNLTRQVKVLALDRAATNH